MTSATTISTEAVEVETVWDSGETETDVTGAGVAVAVGVAVLVGVGVTVGVLVGVEVTVGVLVGVDVLVGVGVTVGVFVGVGVTVGVFVGVPVLVAVGVTVGVSVIVGVLLAVGVIVGVAVTVGVGVIVNVGVIVGVIVGVVVGVGVGGSGVKKTCTAAQSSRKRVPVDASTSVIRSRKLTLESSATGQMRPQVSVGPPRRLVLSAPNVPVVFATVQVAPPSPESSTHMKGATPVTLASSRTCMPSMVAPAGTLML